jgi:hypothetical protein
VHGHEKENEFNEIGVVVKEDDDGGMECKIRRGIDGFV